MYEYLLAAACVLAGLVVLIRMLKENKVFLPVGIFLVLMGGWFLANKLLNGLLNTGWYVWVARGAVFLMILFLIKVMVDESKKKNDSGKGEE